MRYVVKTVLVTSGLGAAMAHSFACLAGGLPDSRPGLLIVLVASTVGYIAYVFGPREC